MYRENLNHLWNTQTHKHTSSTVAYTRATRHTHTHTRLHYTWTRGYHSVHTVHVHERCIYRTETHAQKHKHYTLKGRHTFTINSCCLFSGFIFSPTSVALGHKTPPLSASAQSAWYSLEQTPRGWLSALRVDICSPNGSSCGYFWQDLRVKGVPDCLSSFCPLLNSRPRTATTKWFAAERCSFPGFSCQLCSLQGRGWNN